MRQFLAAICFAALGWWAVAAGATEPAEPLCGRLATQDGLRVLEVWGSPERAGYAHGYLLAREIVGLFDSVVLNEQVGAAPQVYERLVLPQVRQAFTWSPAAQAELNGMLNGLRARLGAEQVRSRVLDRALTVHDLQAINTLADWQALGCSSFSAWGPLTEEGRVLTARNLDYPSTPAMRRVQFLLVNRTADQPQAWVGLTFPGLIGAYTAMNAAGVTISMHDSNGLNPQHLTQLAPRAMTLRAALVKADGDNYLEQVQAVLRKHRTFVGNNIHVSGPRSSGRQRAAVFEYDGDLRSGGVTLRGPGASGELPTPDAVLCTNHMRARRPPVNCGRFTTLTEAITQILRSDRRLDVGGAFDLISRVRQKTTLHTVVFEPQQRRLHVFIPEIVDDIVICDVKALLRRELPGAARKTSGSSKSLEKCPLQEP